ncbi:MAG: hypothetical protein ACKVOW_06275 [Chitinophagaceae bacterium]
MDLVSVFLDIGLVFPDIEYVPRINQLTLQTYPIAKPDARALFLDLTVSYFTGALVKLRSGDLV